MQFISLFLLVAIGSPQEASALGNPLINAAKSGRGPSIEGLVETRLNSEKSLHFDEFDKWSRMLTDRERKRWKRRILLENGQVRWVFRGCAELDSRGLARALVTVASFCVTVINSFFVATEACSGCVLRSGFS